MNRTLSGDVQYENGELGISQCVWCRHRSKGGRRCRAFPTGIPDEIVDNRHDHRLPFDGDFGVRFEPEIVEIEFLEMEDEAVPLKTEMALATARAEKLREGPTLVIELEAEEFSLDDRGPGSGQIASG